MQKSRSLFCAGFSKILAQEFGANISGQNAELFLQAIISSYEKTSLSAPAMDWIRVGAPEESLDWMRSLARKSFICVNEKPNWLDEPCWLFIEDKPMIFVGQIKDTNFLSGQESREVYLFRGILTNALGEKYSVYRTCFQERDTNGYVSMGEYED